MDIISYIDSAIIFKKLLLFIFIICYLGYTKLTFITLLADFEKRIRIEMEKKFIFFLNAFLYTTLGTIFFFHCLLLVIGLIDLDIILTNINLFIVLNSITILYCFWKLYLYTRMGCLSIFNFIASMISDETKKLKYLKSVDQRK